MRRKTKYFWQGRTIRLRPLRIQDADLWLKEDVDSDAICCLSYGIELPNSKKSAREFVNKWANFKNSDKRIMFSIETLSGRLVGGINIHSMDRKNGTFGIGLRIYSQYRKRGYAEEAKRILLRYCFNELRFQKYNCRCLETNKSIIRHFKKVGCRVEGIRRRNIYTNGKYYDELLFGLTKEEFIKNERKITGK